MFLHFFYKINTCLFYKPVMSLWLDSFLHLRLSKLKLGLLPHLRVLLSTFASKTDNCCTHTEIPFKIKTILKHYQGKKNKTTTITYQVNTRSQIDVYFMCKYPFVQIRPKSVSIFNASNSFKGIYSHTNLLFAHTCLLVFKH